MRVILCLLLFIITFTSYWTLVKSDPPVCVESQVNSTIGPKNLDFKNSNCSSPVPRTTCCSGGKCGAEYGDSIIIVDWNASPHVLLSSNNTNLRVELLIKSNNTKTFFGQSFSLNPNLNFSSEVSCTFRWSDEVQSGCRFPDYDLNFFINNTSKNISSKSYTAKTDSITNRTMTLPLNYSTSYALEFQSDTYPNILTPCGVLIFDLSFICFCSPSNTSLTPSAIFSSQSSNPPQGVSDMASVTSSRTGSISYFSPLLSPTSSSSYAPPLTQDNETCTSRIYDNEEYIFLDELKPCDNVPLIIGPNTKIYTRSLFTFPNSILEFSINDTTSNTDNTTRSMFLHPEIIVNTTICDIIFSGRVIIKLNFIPSYSIYIPLISWLNNSNDNCDEVNAPSKKKRSEAGKLFDSVVVTSSAITDSRCGAPGKEERKRNSFGVLLTPVSSNCQGAGGGSGSNYKTRVIVGVVVGVVGGVLVCVLIGLVIGFVVICIVKKQQKKTLDRKFNQYSENAL